MQQAKRSAWVKKKKKTEHQTAPFQGKALSRSPALGPRKAGVLGRSQAVEASHTLHVSERSGKCVLLTAVP